MVLALTVPNGTPGAIKPLLLEGSGPPFPATVTDLGTLLTTLVPLTRELYVDGGTPATLAQQNGSIAFPFKTVQQGVDALALVGGGALLIAPGTYPEAVAAGGTGVPVDFVNLGGSGAAVVITSVVLNGGAVSFFGVSVGGVSVTTTATVRLDRATVAGNLACSGLTAVESTVLGTTTCTTLVGSNSNFNSAVSASSVMLLKDCIFSGALSTTVAGGTTRLDDCRLSSTYAANGAGTTTVLRGCLITGDVQGTTVDLANCTLSAKLTTTGNATARFSSIGDQFICGAAALLYQTRLSNITSVTGALNTDFASIAGVLPVLSYGSIVVQETAPRITLSVAVPAVANDATGYVNVSLVGTDLEGMLTATSLISATPTADLVAAGAGGSFTTCRFQAANSLRFQFLGPLAGGAVNFIVGLV